MNPPDPDAEAAAPVLEAARRWMGPRGWKILHTSAWSLVAKCAAATNLFLTVPFVLHQLGAAEFGVWATLVSLVMFAGFLDFGFGNGTMNLVAAAHGRGADAEARHIVRVGYRNLLWIAAWLAVIILIAIPQVPWHALLGMPAATENDCRASVAALLISVVLAVPLNLANRVQLGLGRGDRAFRWQAIGQSLTTIAVIALAKTHGTLPELTLAAVATPQLASVGNTITLWRDPLMMTAPRANATQEEPIGRNIRREGISFFLLQLAAALAYSADLTLISAICGPTEAGTYAIAQRLFSVVSVGLSLVWAPLWPIYRQALASGDHRWVGQTFGRSVTAAAIFAGAVATILAIGFHRITDIWIHHPVSVSSFLIAGFAIWCVIDAIGTAVATFLNAASILRYQLIYAQIFAFALIVLKALALKHIGITAPPWITSICYVLIVLLPIGVHAKAIRRQIMRTNY